MAEIVIGRFQPTPGADASELELPGPGLYEADLRVPGWLVPDGTIDRVKMFHFGEHEITHIRTVSAGSTLTVRFRIARKPDAVQSVEWVGVALTVGRVLTALAGASIGAFLMAQIVKLVTEVRKLAETPAGIGLAALGIAGAGLLLVSQFRR